MFIANELRKTNIAEYLLYMWQVEDTIRAFDCSISRIRREYIDRFDYKFPFYNAEYYKVLPFIVELRNHGANKEENEIETCFNALYGTMLLRLQKKEITANTQAAVKEITTFIGMLSDYYKKDKEEGLKFE